MPPVVRVHRVDFMIAMAPEPGGPNAAPVVPSHRILGDGSIAVPCRISRTGILEYEYEDGTKSREYRSPDEVFDQRSLDSFKGITLCNLHPEASVDPSTWQAVSIGQIGDDVRPDDIYVAGTAVIKSLDAIEAFKRGDLIELSAGYTCGLIEEPGTSPEGEEYDALQVGIEANHVALGPRDWGRSGGEVRLYSDSKHGKAHRVHSKRKVDQMDPEQLLAKYNETAKENAELKAKITELEAQLAEAKKGGTGTPSTDEAPKGDADGEDGDEPPKGDKKDSVDQMFARIERKNSIVAKVKAITKDSAFEGGTKSNRELILAGLKHLDPKFDDKGKSVDYLQALLDERHVQTARERARNDNTQGIVSAITAKVDGSTPGTVDKKDQEEDPYAAYEKRQAERWKTTK